jgi:ATP-dependent HslUV protease ATP-binding subunit HslU
MKVGFHGKDVDQIIRDLVDISINMTKKRIKEEIKQEISMIVEEKLLNELIGTHADAQQRDSFRSMLREGALEDKEIDVEVPMKSPLEGLRGSGGAITFDSQSVSDIAKAVNTMMSGVSSGGRFKGGKNSSSSDRKRMKVSEARPIIEDSEVEKLLEEYDIPKEAIAAVEESGIVFIDEIDKLVSSGDYRGADASSEGVQRDLLPLIEGSTINTKHGNVNTDFILFIASGAFHAAKPSDLLAELQGRLPIRVTLQGLTEEDLYRILTEPVTNLLRQQVEMMKSEHVQLTFTEDAIREIAHVAYTVSLSYIYYIPIYVL